MTYNIIIKKIHLINLIYYILSIVFIIPLFLGNYLCDDCYIYARIIDNYHISGFPFYQLDLPLKAASSTGYLLICSFLRYFFQSIKAIIFFQVLTYILYLLVSNYVIKSKYKFYNLIAFLSATSGFLMTNWSGMDTSIVCVLFLVIFYHLVQNNLLEAILFASISACFRLECLALYILIIIYSYFRKKYALKQFILYSLPLICLWLFDFYNYNTIIPFAAHAKTLVYGYPFMQSLHNMITMGHGYLGIFFVSAYLCLFLVELYYLMTSRFSIADKHIFLVFTFILFLAWSVSRSVFFPWYFCLFSTPFAIYFYLDFRLKKTIVYDFIFYMQLIVLVGCFILPMEYIFNDASRLRVSTYLKIGSALNYSDIKGSLVTSEIGAIGFGFRGNVYDALGLTDQNALKYHPMTVPYDRPDYGVGAIPIQYVKYRDPQFIVTMPVFSDALRRSNILKNYYGYYCKLIKPVYGDSVVLVYSKTPISTKSISIMSAVLFQNRSN